MASARPTATIRRLVALSFVRSFSMPVMFLDVLILALLLSFSVPRARSAFGCLPPMVVVLSGFYRALLRHPYFGWVLRAAAGRRPAREEGPFIQHPVAHAES